MMYPAYPEKKNWAVPGIHVPTPDWTVHSIFRSPHVLEAIDDNVVSLVNLRWQETMEDLLGVFERVFESPERLGGRDKRFSV